MIENKKRRIRSYLSQNIKKEYKDLTWVFWTMYSTRNPKPDKFLMKQSSIMSQKISGISNILDTFYFNLKLKENVLYKNMDMK